MSAECKHLYYPYERLDCLCLVSEQGEKWEFTSVNDHFFTQLWSQTKVR